MLNLLRIRRAAGSCASAKGARSSFRAVARRAGRKARLAAALQAQRERLQRLGRHLADHRHPPVLHPARERVRGAAGEHAFLHVALEDARDSQRYIVRNPRFHTLGAQIVQLYDEIVARATENEKTRGDR